MPTAPPPGEIKLPEATPDLMFPGEVAALWRVDPKTLWRWEEKGLFPEGTSIRTPGGSRRYRKAGIEQLLNGQGGGRS